MVILVMMEYKTEKSCNSSSKTRKKPFLRPIFSTKPKSFLPTFNDSNLDVEVIRHRYTKKVSWNSSDARKEGTSEWYDS